MEKEKQKSNLSIVILSIVLALSLSVTVALAAFSANKSGSLTLSFADGLTMTISQKNYNNNASYLKVTAAGTGDYTFNYTAQTNSIDGLYYDGVIATLNKPGWVSVQIRLMETTSGSSVAPTGVWTKSNDKTYYFKPSGTKTDWTCGIDINYSIFATGSISNNTLTFIGAASWTTDALSLTLWDDWTFRNPNWNMRNYINDLAGRSFEVLFTVKARTDAAPTF